MGDYKDSSNINGPASIKVDKVGSEIELAFDKDKYQKQVTLFALFLTMLAIGFMPIKYLIEQYLIMKEANDDIDKKEF